MKRLYRAVLVVGVLVLASEGWPQAVQDAPKPAPVREDCSKVWLTHPASEFDTFLATAPIERMEDLPIGVTKPRRVYFPAGGLAARAVWKPLRPGIHSGYQDSYTAEIAGYELDKLLGLQMVPPYVERKIGNETGAVGYWVENTKPWKIGQAVSPPDPELWAHEIAAMKIFDQLIGNMDRNQGNLLYDVDFHLILIDHSRAFTSSTDISDIPKPTRIIRTLWDKMAALTEADLQGAIGKWVEPRDLKAVLQRRDKIAEEVRKIVKDRGERAAFMK